MRKLSIVAGVATALVLTMSGCADQGDNGSAGYTVEFPTTTATLGTFDPLATYPPTADSPATQPQTTGVSGTTPPRAAPTPTASGTKPNRVDAEKFAVGSQYPPAYELFTPTGNIGCDLNFYDSASITCTAKDGGVSADNQSCPEGQAHAINLDASGTRQVCLPPNDLVPELVLNYGDMILTHGAMCTSNEDTGITCYLGERGFTLSRDINRTF